MDHDEECSSDSGDQRDVDSYSVAIQTEIQADGICSQVSSSQTEGLRCHSCGASMRAIDLTKDMPLFEKARRLRDQQHSIEEFISESKSQLERVKAAIGNCIDNRIKREILSESRSRTPVPLATPVDCFVNVQALRSSGETTCRLSDAGRQLCDPMTRSPCMSPSPIRRRNINHWAQSPAEPSNRSNFPVVRPVTIEELGELERKK